MAVHRTFSRNWILRSGLAISGRMLQKGLMTSRNLTVGFGSEEKWISITSGSSEKMHEINLQPILDDVRLRRVEMFGFFFNKFRLPPIKENV